MPIGRACPCYLFQVRNDWGWRTTSGSKALFVSYSSSQRASPNSPSSAPNWLSLTSNLQLHRNEVAA